MRADLGAMAGWSQPPGASQDQSRKNERIDPLIHRRARPQQNSLRESAWCRLLAHHGRADRDRERLTVGLQRTRLPRARTDASDAF
jgi:hypothetical protein